MCCFLSVSQLCHIQGRKASSDICKEIRSQVPMVSVLKPRQAEATGKSKECSEISAIGGM